MALLYHRDRLFRHVTEYCYFHCYRQCAAIVHAACDLASIRPAYSAAGRTNTLVVLIIVLAAVLPTEAIFRIARNQIVSSASTALAWRTHREVLGRVMAAPTQFLETESASRIGPGMIVSAEIVTGAKSFLRYLLRPVIKVFGPAFSER